MSGASSASYSFARLRLAVRIHAQRRLLHRRPAGVVEHDGEDRQPVLLRHRVDRRRIAEVEAAVAARPAPRSASGRASFTPSAVPPENPRPPPASPTIVPGTGARDLVEHRERVADRLVHDDVVRPDRAADLGAEVLRVDLRPSRPCRRRASRAPRLRARVLGAPAPRRASPPRRGTPASPSPSPPRSAARGSAGCRPGIRRFAAKSHIGKPCLTTSTSMCAQNVAGFSRRVARDPRHVDVDQQAEVRLGDVLARDEAGAARRVGRDVEMERVELEHADAREPRELVEQRRRRRVAARVRRDEQRMLRRDQPVGEQRDRRRVRAARLRPRRSAPAGTSAPRSRPRSRRASRAGASGRPAPSDRSASSCARGAAPPSRPRPRAASTPTSRTAARSTPGRTAPARSGRRCRASRSARRAAVNGARPAISSTGIRPRQALCIATAEFPVPTSTWTSTPWPRPVAIA